ncbi:HlyD family efflux transporter periplasmic adaptor subunit [Cupriavidus malaysiensis]|uniref:HlyD family efflux transporter periplasmic adaptor subunit n=2 Tax=Pseudomonadota TaxID=1224 RepID=UPI000AB82AD2|nr:HlyD family efflux transporter periplasmic adaptor subunit [Cupriavidus malaysiensis]
MPDSLEPDSLEPDSLEHRQDVSGRPATALHGPTHEGQVADWRRPLAARPLWRLLPRTAGYGFVLFVVWAVLTVMFPNVFTRSSERAVVNSPVILITSPVEGVVTGQMVAAGRPFQAGQGLMTVQNPNIDRSLLVELTGKKLDNQQRYDAAKAKLEGEQALLAANTRDLQRYHAAAEQEHSANVRALQARLAAAKAQVDQQEEVVNRNQAMQWAGAVSEAYTNASRYQLSVLNNARAAVKAELDNAVGNREASKSKVFISATDGPVAALQQQHVLLSADIVQLQAQMQQLQDYGASVDKLIASEQSRLERLSNLEIRATDAGVIEDVLAAPGTRVAAGATLARASNCSQTRVVAVFPRSLSDDLLPGTRLRVHIDGVPSELPAAVADILPRAPDGEQARYFVPFPPIEKNEIYVIAKLDKPLPATPRLATADAAQRCAMGRWAKVSLVRSWLGTRL